MLTHKTHPATSSPLHFGWRDNQISLGSLVPHNIQVYGSDTTYYIATSASAIPPILTKPDVS